MKPDQSNAVGSSHSRPEDAEHEGSDAEMSPRPSHAQIEANAAGATDRELLVEILFQLHEIRWMQIWQLKGGRA